LHGFGFGTKSGKSLPLFSFVVLLKAPGYKAGIGKYIALLTALMSLWID
jgi:hypothetical protein